MSSSPSNVLISVSNKTNLDMLAKAFLRHGKVLYSTGGTRTYLMGRGIEVKDIHEVTGFPEILDGRVKTLHPGIHGGILAGGGNVEHLKQLGSYGYPLFEVVVVNLYPFGEVLRREGFDEAKVIEAIDIGGVALLRAAAKNHRRVMAVTDPNDYKDLIRMMDKRSGSFLLEERRKFAIKAFEYSVFYDKMIVGAFKEHFEGKKVSHFDLNEYKSLRYGENPHQKGGIFFGVKDMVGIGDAGGLGGGEGVLGVFHGKAMSYNNVLDVHSALRVLRGLKDLGSVGGMGKLYRCVIVKHGNTCGVCVSAGNGVLAISGAWEGDIISAYGSIVACDFRVTLLVAKFLGDKFIEVLIGAGYTACALDYLKRKRNIRLIELGAGGLKEGSMEYRFVGSNMILEQERDGSLYEKFECVTRRSYLREEKGLYIFSYSVVKYLRSNAIAICYRGLSGEYVLLGMGAGQVNRVDAVERLAIPKAKETLIRLHGKEEACVKMGECVLASDAFFPFHDSIEAAGAAGIRKIIQPGGSIRDKRVIQSCDDLGITMIFTGQRHFSH